MWDKRLQPPYGNLGWSVPFRTTIFINHRYQEGAGLEVHCIDSIIGFSFFIAGAAGMTVDFSANRTSGPAPLTVSFNDPVAWVTHRLTWYFGDENFTAPWALVNVGWVAGKNGHSSVMLPDGSIVVTGGNAGGNLRNDTWRSADNGVTWTQANPGARVDSKRRAHQCGDAGRQHRPDGRFHDSGGFDPDKNDVWRSTDNGATWTQMNASAGWSARVDHSSVALPDGSIVLMGGIGTAELR